MGRDREPAADSGAYSALIGGSGWSVAVTEAEYADFVRVRNFLIIFLPENYGL